MNEKQLLYVNVGLVIGTVLFIISSFATAQSESAHSTMVLISEILGGLTIISAMISLYYIKSDQKYIPIAILSFFVPWIVYVVGHHAGINQDTNFHWIWFVSLYILSISGIILMRISYNAIQGLFALLPVFLMFLNAMFFVYTVVLFVWWSLPDSIL
ncbi:hypothetical protein [Halobacillus salinus]|uniref:hypothetical protein n=1 Tax=Halobacillus salinus TaxID=192814 RepID=UPI0009A852AC|nr:hypothetical protein [Halobacillus salinus]